ncbi:Aste57867_11080 [Aphanomyces stellatus]|uniref:ADP-ribosyl cyclase/cyclic ADP-ribose hydrolase n=1 Tax=Aphanomyces stellatus TaxID=120398 RepID=A0A485KSK4_9STRA|nr:hypothetical protein As57867_011038 [Aphanomyces stellatus]VFT87947.1 Aste57867_11080 [Aphanomyces stellatus]
MGSAASLATLSATDVATQVSLLGSAYTVYTNSFISNGIDGAILAQLSDAELQSLLVDIGVTSAVHRKLLGLHLAKLKGPRPHIEDIVPGPSVAPIVSAHITTHMRPPTTSLSDRVTHSPSVLLGRLFSFQGVHLIDPDDMESVVQKICLATGPSRCDGDVTYDCFLNYRVASEKDVAEKLYLYLRTRQLHPFLDRMSLKNGEPWKDGFLRGLTQSRLFVALVSDAALARCRDDNIDHTTDNVLLEYESALAIADADPAFMILPVYVAAEISSGGFVKFQDFSPEHYSPMLRPALPPLAMPDLVMQKRRQSNKDYVAAHSKDMERPRRHSDCDAQRPPTATTDINRKLSVSESMGANVPALLNEALKMDDVSPAAMETLFGLAQRSKCAIKIVQAGGVPAMLAVLGCGSSSMDTKDTAAAVLSLLAMALVKRQGVGANAELGELMEANTERVLQDTLSTGSEIQKQYLVVSLMHFAAYDATVRSRLKESTELQACFLSLAKAGSITQRDACRALLSRTQDTAL